MTCATRFCDRCEKSHPITSFSKGRGRGGFLNHCDASRKRPGRPRVVVPAVVADDSGAGRCHACRARQRGGKRHVVRDTFGRGRGTVCGRCLRVLEQCRRDPWSLRRLADMLIEAEF